MSDYVHSRMRNELSYRLATKEMTGVNLAQPNTIIPALRVEDNRNQISHKGGKKKKTE